MDRKLLTIVVPSFNVEKYLNECIPPYVTPVCDKRLEVLIVNDGSTDATIKIAESFAEQFPDVIRVINKENGGHGSTINSGLQEAKGKYFKVIDGDDYVSNSELIRFIDMLEHSNEDAITNDKVNFYEGTDKSEKHLFAPVEYDKTISIENINREWNYSMHRIAVKTELLKSHMPPIDEHCFYVDQEFIFYSLAYVKTIRASDAIIYYYRLGNANQSVSKANMFKRRDNLLKVINSLLAFYPTILENVMYESEMDYINYNLGKQYDQYARIILTNEKSSKDDVRSVMNLYNRLKAEYPGIYNHIRHNKGTKLVRMFGVKAYVKMLLPVVSKNY